jgi:hypothetical protein
MVQDQRSAYLGLLEIVGVIRERKTENPIIGFNPGLDRPSMKMSKRSSGTAGRVGRRAGHERGVLGT